MRFLFVFLPLLVFAQPLDLEVKGERVVLINGKTGHVLFEKNGNELCHPASTTKIGTALYAMHMRGNDLDSVMTTQQEAVRAITPEAKKQSKYRSPPHWLETDGSHIGLKKGEEMTFRNLLHAILIASANDASNVVAENIGGTIPHFVDNMNHYLTKIGCRNTRFNNPHGLTHPDHLTTAFDLACMAKEALNYPLFREIICKSRYTCPETNLEYERHFIQTNRLLRQSSYFYPKAIGMKTGTTKAAGKNLVAAAEEGERLLIGVFLGYKGAGDLYLEAKRLFEAAFNEVPLSRTLLPEGQQTMTQKVAGCRKKLQTYLPEKLSYQYFPAEECKVKLLVHWKLPELPILQGEQVGRLEVVDAHHNVLQVAPLYAFEDLSSTLWNRVFGGIHGKKTLLVFAALPVIFLLRRFRRP